jgi:DNA-binding transcriptional regulator YhcF (GntR family)
MSCAGERGKTDYLFQLPDERYGTLQTQIQEMMVGAILSKQLPAGCLLPSGRKLARQLKVSRNTVVLAYLHLMDEGFINSRERSGFYVHDDVLNGYAKARQKKQLRLSLLLIGVNVFVKHPTFLLSMIGPVIIPIMTVLNSLNKFTKKYYHVVVFSLKLMKY